MDFMSVMVLLLTCEQFLSLDDFLFMLIISRIPFDVFPFHSIPRSFLFSRKYLLQCLALFILISSSFLNGSLVLIILSCNLIFTAIDVKRPLVIQGLLRDFFLLFEVSCKGAQKLIWFQSRKFEISVSMPWFSKFALKSPRRTVVLFS